MPPAVLHPLTSYLPKLTELGGSDGAPPAQTPHRESVFSAVLFADLVGFTACTAALEAEQGGAERIGQLLNAHLRPLVRACEAHGGDIVKFAGDALLVCWPIHDDDDDGVRQAILAAASCALAMQAAIAALTAQSGGRAMQLRVGLGAGPVRILHLGTSSKRRVLLVSGDGIDRATRGGALAHPGEVRIGRLAQQLVGEELQVAWDGELSVLTAVTPLDPFAPPPPPTRQWHPQFAHYLSSTVRARTQEGARGWITETRVVSVMFVHLPDLTFGADPADMDLLITTTHGAVSHHGGVTNKISIDEKGATLLVAFGLPPRVHEDNAARACRAALAIQGALRRTGHRVSMGIATGRTFCGEIGGRARREYTVIGDTVNTAARLMQSGPGDISTDTRTARQAASVIQLQKLPAVELKGKSEPVQRHRPVGTRRTASPQAPRPIGRGRLLETIDARAAELLQSGQPQVALVVGPAGIGKSAVGQSATQSWADKGLTVVRTHGDGLTNGRPGTPLRALLQALYGTGPTPQEMHRVQAALRTAAGADTRVLGQVEGLLPVPLPSSHGASARPERSVQVELMVRLLVHGVGQTPTVLFIEDAHWLDSFTLSVLANVSRSTAPVYLFMTARPPPDASEQVWTALRTLTTPIPLHALSRTDTRSLLARRLKVAQVPRSLGDLVFARSGGNPLFILHLADHLCETGAVDIHKRQLKVRADPMIRWQAGLPMTIESLLLARVDRLEAGAQFTLKVASIFGERFDQDSLRAAHPLDPTDAQLVADLAELERQEVIAPTATHNEWRFRHILIRDAVYEILSARQRRGLHATAAEHLAAQDPVRWFDVAEHARKALQDDVAMEAYSQAAAEAARLGSCEAATRVMTAVSNVLLHARTSHRQFARVAMAESVLHETSGDHDSARRCLQVAVDRLQASTDADPPSQDAELALAHLLSARLHRGCGLHDAAITHAQAARAQVDDASPLATQATALEVSSTWLSQGTIPAARLLPKSTDGCWSLQVLAALFDAATARSDTALHAAIQATHALLTSPAARHAPVEDRQLFGRAAAGLALFIGEPHQAVAVLDHDGGTRCSRAADARTIAAIIGNLPERRSPTSSLDKKHQAAPLVRALESFATGHGPADLEPLEGPMCPDANGAPITMADWPELFGAVLLAEAAPDAWTPEGLARLDQCLVHAGRHTPSAKAALHHLRGRLTGVRGQRVRSWMMQTLSGSGPDRLGWFGARATLPPAGSRPHPALWRVGTEPQPQAQEAARLEA